MRLINHPVLCNYYVTYRCNATCSFCDIWEKPSPYVTPENVDKNLNDLKKLGVKVIDFTGGEPLLHRQIDELLYMAKAKGFVTTLTTNALLYPKWAKKIAGLVDMLHFSLDFSTAEKHDTARGTKCFSKVMESIKIARAIGVKPDILFTVFKENLEEIEPVYQISRKNELVLILNPSFQYNEVGINTGLSEAQLQYLSKWGNKKGIYLNQAFIELRKNGGNNINTPVCKAGSSTIVISPENKLIMPCYHLGMQEFAIDDSLFHIYNTKEVRNAIAMEGRYSKCDGCTINCYMQPSFAVNYNKYWRLAFPSTLKYNMMKGTWKSLFTRNKKLKKTLNKTEKLTV